MGRLQWHAVLAEGVQTPRSVAERMPSEECGTRAGLDAGMAELAAGETTQKRIWTSDTPA
jgi:hypothetical protein